VIGADKVPCGTAARKVACMWAGASAAEMAHSRAQTHCYGPRNGCIVSELTKASISRACCGLPQETPETREAYCAQESKKQGWERLNRRSQAAVPSWICEVDARWSHGPGSGTERLKRDDTAVRKSQLDDAVEAFRFWQWNG
jgi:hypothetical protein